VTKSENLAESAGYRAFYNGAILLVEPQAAYRTQWQKQLASAFAHIEAVDNAEMALALCQRYCFDALVVNTELNSQSGLELVEQLRARENQAEVVFVTHTPTFEVAQQALRLGAVELFSWPLEVAQLLTTLQRSLTHPLDPPSPIHTPMLADMPAFVMETEIVCESHRFKALCEVVQRIAPTHSTVLLVGETGTGKELLARGIHIHSGRTGEFVPVNCGAIAPELLESELFGHVKGAFTSAHQPRDGLFSYADGGTLFLDEIGEMPLPMQAKLLRVLEERKVRAVGTEKEMAVDVRIIAATNRQLEQAVQAGQFRRDLYYRLNVLSLEIPPLRERVEDIAPLANHFIQTLAIQLGVSKITLSPADIEQLHHQPWLGNVRELRNVIERALLLGKPPRECLAVTDATEITTVAEPHTSGYPLEWKLEAIEQHHTLKVLAHLQGNKSEAARWLGVSRKTLERRLQAWEVG